MKQVNTTNTSERQLANKSRKASNIISMFIAQGMSEKDMKAFLMLDDKEFAEATRGIEESSSVTDGNDNDAIEAYEDHERWIKGKEDEYIDSFDDGEVNY